MSLAHWHPKKLTPRMSQCLLLLAKGHTTKGVAHEIGVSKKTADKTRQGLLYFYNTSCTTSMVVKALKAGHVKLEDL